jgi:hypothetical protein
MDNMLRFPGGVTRDPAVEKWLSEGPAELKAIARKWFARMRQCGDDVNEQLHDGHPTACVSDVPFGYVNAFTSHVNVGFFNRVALKDPAGLLEGAGKYMRHVKLRPGVAINEEALGKLITSAYLDCRARVGE